MDANDKAIQIAHRVFNTEVNALIKTDGILGDTFAEIVSMIQACSGKLIITGMGKSGHVARKMAATLASLGTSAFFLHPGEAMHGDLGMIQKNDLVLAISYSGESDEIVKIIPNIKIIGSKIIGITCNRESTLAKHCDLVQIFQDVTEACHLGLAPTTSTTVVMVYGDALAVALSEINHFSKKQFGVFHPAGSLGKKLTLRSIDLMTGMETGSLLPEDSYIGEAVIRFCNGEYDILPVQGNNGRLVGILTNGEVERAVKDKKDIWKETIKPIMNRYPVYVDSDTMALEALKIMLDQEIHAVPVVKEERVIGILSKARILRAGIYV